MTNRTYTIQGVNTEVVLIGWLGSLADWVDTGLSTHFPFFHGLT